MKRVSLKLGALALMAGVALLVAPTKVSAAVVSVQIGGPPPPPPAAVPPPWARPYRSAVWIPGHYEAINGRWVWVAAITAIRPARASTGCRAVTSTAIGAPVTGPNIFVAKGARPIGWAPLAIAGKKKTPRHPGAFFVTGVCAR